MDGPVGAVGKTFQWHLVLSSLQRFFRWETSDPAEAGVGILTRGRFKEQVSCPPEILSVVLASTTDAPPRPVDRTLWTGHSGWTPHMKTRSFPFSLPQAPFFFSLALALVVALGVTAQDKKQPPAPAQPSAEAKQPNPHGEPEPALTKEQADAIEGRFLSGSRQLTLGGKRSGEGYFSADGHKLIFQSERDPDNPFYQIYVLDLENGDLERISPGQGKTTCAWLHPDGKRALFASTQEDPESVAKQKAELDFRASGQQRRYSWDYDEHFDIQEYDFATKTYHNLTHTQGYDAEGAYSPDGSHVVFASNRHAYTDTLDKAHAERFALDKSSLMDIYTMKADGSEVKRLTDTDGYDGGPFYSADGTKICWRRFDKDGFIAEIHTMNADGTDPRQITHLGAMSWAPFFHPSGDYLIFATNKHGFDNFELYLVDAAGKHDPVRVTSTKGFDGLPCFSPDGKQLAWTSNRTPDKQSQIFLANWDHDAARHALELEGSPAASAALVPADRPSMEQTAPEIRVEDLKQHIGYLASDALQGRLTGTPGEQEATAYVAKAFESFGLEPAGDQAGWFQPFGFTAGVALGPDNRLTMIRNGGSETLAPDKDWRPISFSRNGELGAGGIVFAGYGMEVPAENAKGPDDTEYSSYFHLDVKGKWVMVLRFSPENAPKEQREKLQRFAHLRHKAMVARRKFAQGIIFVSGPNSKSKNDLIPMEFDAAMADSGIPAISVTREVAERMLKGSGKDLKSLQDELDKGEPVAGFPLPGVELAAHIDVAQETRTGRNVLAILRADDQPAAKQPAVLLGAHVDHLGPSAGPGSLAREDEKQLIHHGADDNASGVAGMLEIAQWLADQKKAGKLPLKRDIVFAAWSGEEIGLLGSAHYVRVKAKAASGDENASLRDSFAAYLNLDMIGRLDKSVLLQGIGSSPYWASAIEQRNAPIGLPVTLQNDTYLPTDATNFYLRQVPILAAFTGAHSDYHTPRDTADKVRYEGARNIAKLFAQLTRGLALTADVPEYVKVDPPKNQGARGFRVFLGTIPDYSQGDLKGVKLSGVSGGGPADKAGVKGGDIITGLAGKEILNIYDYTAILGELKPGQETEIEVDRDGKKIKLKLMPGSRD